jgi:hypothetical protein
MVCLRGENNAAVGEGAGARPMPVWKTSAKVEGRPMLCWKTSGMVEDQSQGGRPLAEYKTEVRAEV